MWMSSAKSSLLDSVRSAERLREDERDSLGHRKKVCVLGLL